MFTGEAGDRKTEQGSVRHVVNVSCVYRGVCVCAEGLALASLELWVPDVLSFIIAKNIHTHTQSNHCWYH